VISGAVARFMQLDLYSTGYRLVFLRGCCLLAWCLGQQLRPALARRTPRWFEAQSPTPTPLPPSPSLPVPCLVGLVPAPAPARLRTAPRAATHRSQPLTKLFLYFLLLPGERAAT
jgi:hypothetical protein